MLQDKKSELDAVKTRKLLERLVHELSRNGFDLYYASTSVVARSLRDYIRKDAGLNADEHKLIGHLSQRDLELLLSIRSE